MSQIPNDSKVKLVLWSGGPDSTACLIDLLQYTDDPVIAYHIFHYKDSDYNSNNNLYAMEQQQFAIVQQLYHILQQRYRLFKFHYCSMAIPQKTEHGREVGLFPLIEAVKQNATIFIGRCNDDIVLQNLFLTNPLFVNRKNVANKFGINIIDYNYNIDKKQIRQRLGEYLWDMTISCIDPSTEGLPCNHCIRCQQRTATN